jgi:predicted RNA-binding protein YlqC (UPF0109 family)
MNEHEHIHGLLVRMIQGIVDCPDQVAIEVDANRTRTKFLIRVHPSDVGKVIGKQGRNVQSLRIVANAMGMKARHLFLIAVEEPGQHRFEKPEWTVLADNCGTANIASRSSQEADRFGSDI